MVAAAQLHHVDDRHTGYEAWRAAHTEYVLMPPGDRLGYAPDRYMLHRSACVQLVSTSGALLLEGHPRWCGARSDLIDWTMRETGVLPALCPTCAS